ncbi:hypothetical protein BD309DRAFT_452434 [Dichomitus squalens]|uniref:Uncharacterized protein n=1 Tax=Dichomitus squalens TaxID=114155 RepID=A0A4Q9NDX6_9APHY|nr:hypothetical protein BD309DRAFT_452434 [Dichomitus squalens]TBU52550.1 hypothetical protein BD310DRAFT_861710 [Dichomitus squalens]
MAYAAHGSWISHIAVRYGDQPSQQPPERVLAQHGESDDINYQYGGKYVWLVPQYTTNPHQAATRFDIVIQEHGDPAPNDLAKGAGGDFRYLIPRKDITAQRKVVQVVLCHQDHELFGTPEGWDRCTIDINKIRGKTYLYLLWKTAIVG